MAILRGRDEAVRHLTSGMQPREERAFMLLNVPDGLETPRYVRIESL